MFLLSAVVSSEVSLWMLVPFAALLAMIALCPLVCAHWWHKNYPLVAVAGALITGSIYLFSRKYSPLLHALHEYAGFIILIASLYIVAGGIHIRVKGESTPAVNCLFLFIGAVLANIIGTTGASMLMIRPWVRLNKYRITTYHIVFFIFIISNVGGCLTPIGDPPLFLGFLKGVPFWWTLQYCWQAWLMVTLLLIAIFYGIDRRNFSKGPKSLQEFAQEPEEWRFSGLRNLLFLVGILVSVFLPPGWREAGLAASALGSWFSTPKQIHQANDFAFAPLKEVAWLFLGIFVTMIPALEYLQQNGKEIGIASEHGFYWATGLLSGILDNAPTYLAFLATAFGLYDLSLDDPAHMVHFLANYSSTLMAISIGAVFFGAMTYIGNGPNFMVKAIAEHMRIKMPTFFGYIVRFSIPILLPVLAFAGWVFLTR